MFDTNHAFNLIAIVFPSLAVASLVYWLASDIVRDHLPVRTPKED